VLQILRQSWNHDVRSCPTAVQAACPQNPVDLSCAGVRVVRLRDVATVSGRGETALRSRFGA
jgi:hypothetical protein